MRDEVNVTAADEEMAMRVRDWTESEAHTHLHKHGPRRHKSCGFLSVAVLVLRYPDPRVHVVVREFSITFSLWISCSY